MGREERESLSFDIESLTERRKIKKLKMGKDDYGESGSVEVMMPDGFGSSFSTKEIRAKFIRKVYATLFSQLLITIGFIAVFVFTLQIKNFYCTDVYEDGTGIIHCVRPSHEGFIMYIVSYVIFFVTYFALMCCKSVRRKSPVNMIVMGIFTLALSIWVASISIYHDAYWNWNLLVCCILDLIPIWNFGSYFLRQKLSHSTHSVFGSDCYPLLLLLDLRYSTNYGWQEIRDEPRGTHLCVNCPLH